MGKYIDGSGLSHFMGIIKGALAGKSDTGHTHSQYVPTSRKVNGHALTSDVTVTASDIGVASGAEVNQNAFSNVKVGSTTIAADAKQDTLEMIQGNGVSLIPDDSADSIRINLDVDTDVFGFSSGALTANAVGSSNNGVMTPALLTKLNGIATGAEVNQNAFSNVKVGSTTVAADAKTDTLELVAGTNVTLTPDATNDKVTIAATDTTALGSMTGTLGVAHGGTGVSTLGAGVVYHSASGTGALSIATAANIVSALGTTAVNRATADASGNNIANTYAKAQDVADTIEGLSNDIDNALITKAPLASPALTGTPTAPTAAAGTNTTQIATTAFVTNAVGTATAGALQYKGVVTAESGISGTSYKKGWYWIVGMPNSSTTSITIAGKNCEAGDMVIAKQDKTSTLANDLDIIQTNIEVLSNSEIDTLWAAA